MSILTTKLNIGAPAPFRIIHMADTHLTYADMRDGERKVALSAKRAPIFPHAEDVLQTAAKTAADMEIPILHSGDLIDFVSAANLERVQAFTRETDCFTVAGNHEFSQYVGEAKEDAAYRNQSLDTVQKSFKNNIRMAARVIGGVNFVALDNGYYQIDAEQLAFLKEEVCRNLPVVLLMHNPLFEPTLYEIRKKAASAALLAVPEPLMAHYPPRCLEQERADETTLAAVDYIKTAPNIKAVLAGHIHCNYEGMITDALPQITTSCTDIRIVEFA